MTFFQYALLWLLASCMHVDLKQNNYLAGLLRISGRWVYVLEDSYNQLWMRLNQDLKGRLNVQHQVGNNITFQPNPNSVSQTENLSYIIYVGSMVADYELQSEGRNVKVLQRKQSTSSNDFVSRELISIFNDKEPELLIGGLPEIDLDDLKVNTEYTGYTVASNVNQWFCEVASSFRLSARKTWRGCNNLLLECQSPASVFWYSLFIIEEFAFATCLQFMDSSASTLASIQKSIQKLILLGNLVISVLVPAEKG
uniref:HECT-type E3 ubiquitin transferase n=1 Tax=Chenopodium quinoa TaxID=63459 RepID=A0A803MWN2_CHEQI